MAWRPDVLWHHPTTHTCFKVPSVYTEKDYAALFGTVERESSTIPPIRNTCSRHWLSVYLFLGPVKGIIHQWLCSFLYHKSGFCYNILNFSALFGGSKRKCAICLPYYSQKALNCRRWVISTTIIFFIFPTLDMSHILDKTALEMHVAPWIFSMSEVVVY